MLPTTYLEILEALGQLPPVEFSEGDDLRGVFVSNRRVKINGYLDIEGAVFYNCLIDPSSVRNGLLVKSNLETKAAYDFEELCIKHDVSLCNTDLRNADLRGLLFTERTRFGGTDLRGADLRNCTFHNISFLSAKLDDVLLDGAFFIDCSFKAEHKHIVSPFVVGDSTFFLDKSKGFRNADLSNLNLQYADLQNADFSFAKLTGANLQDADLQNADFSFANLTGVNLNNINANKSTFKQALMKSSSLIGAQLRRADMSYADMSRANLKGANFRGSKIERAKFIHTDLTGADFTAAYLGHSNFIFAKIGYATTFRDANISDCVFESRVKDLVKNQSLGGAYFVGQDANWKDADLSGLDLSGIHFYKANLENANLSDTQLVGSSFIDTTLRNVNLANANLFDSGFLRADLANANLENTNIADARISESSFIDANLSGANLANAEVEYCNFAGADLTNANLDTAVVRHTVGLEAFNRPSVLDTISAEDLDFSEFFK